jgi:hypothetical protein
MKNWKTTLGGTIAALSLGGFAGLGLHDPWPRVLLLVCSAALAALGYHATDCTNCPGNKVRLASLGACLLLLGGAVGCTVAGFGLTLSAPPYGSLGVTIGGGSIGNRPRTNPAPELPPVLTNAAPVK